MWSCSSPTKLKITGKILKHELQTFWANWTKIHHGLIFLRSPCLKTALIFHQILVTISLGKYRDMYSYGDDFTEHYYYLFVCGYWGQYEQSKASLLAKL